MLSSHYFSPVRLSKFSIQRPKITIAIWVILLIAAAFPACRIDNILEGNPGPPASTEAGKAETLINENLRIDTPVQEFVIVESSSEESPDSSLAIFVDTIVADLRKADTVESVTSYRDNIPSLLSKNGHIALIPVALSGERDRAASNAQPVVDIVTTANSSTPFRVSVAGEGSISAEFSRLADETVRQGETIGISIALVILLAVFGAAVAASLPIILALVSVIVALGATALLGQVLDLSTFVTQIITMIGLAVGIDYSLFIVQRFREERASQREIPDAILVACRSAGITVLFSGAAVVIALSGMIIIPETTFRSLGIGAVLVVVAAVLAALTLLPAVLSILGDKIDRFTFPFLRKKQGSEAGGFWKKLTLIVIKRPKIATGATAALLIAASVSVIMLNLGTTGIEALPEGSESRHAFEVLDSEFNSEFSTAEIVISSPAINTNKVQNAIDTLIGFLQSDPVFGQIKSERNKNTNDLLLLSVDMRGAPESTAAFETINRLRSDYIPKAFENVSAEIFVSGHAAQNVDAVEFAKNWFPGIFAFVLGFSFLLLLLAFRSIVVPIKAVVMNALSVAAAYGLLVLVFQEGIGAKLFGFQQSDSIQFWLPIFLFSVLFGLSMDYHVFLLSRIKERFDLTKDNSASVAFGLQSTGSIITGAALIMVAVFGGFALGDLVILQQTGFGLAAAIIIDATLIRSILVPASMELLGKWNWYFPHWLNWLPQIHIEAIPNYEGVTERTNTTAD